MNLTKEQINQFMELYPEEFSRDQLEEDAQYYESASDLFKYIFLDENDKRSDLVDLINTMKNIQLDEVDSSAQTVEEEMLLNHELVRRLSPGFVFVWS